MGLLGKIARFLGFGYSRSAVRRAIDIIRARYDAAQSTSENKRRWKMADALSAKSANSKDVRAKLVSRSRYVIANGPFARGIIDTKINDLIGTGPTPNCGLPGSKTDKGLQAQCNQVEDVFEDWCDAVGFLSSLRTSALAWMQDGEGIFLLSNYDEVNHPVQLYPLGVETDQMTSIEDRAVDGMQLDRLGNPVSYEFLKSHPGDKQTINFDAGGINVVPARNVVHWFKRDRVGQCRGIPHLTPALELFEQLRTFRMATLTAAETAALLTLLLQSSAPPDGSTVDPAPFSALDLERGLMTELPGGYNAFQLKAEHPATTYEMFLYCLLAEACRCLQVPLNIAMGTSQKFNFSSARLDFLNYRASLRVDRRLCEKVVLTPIFRAWLEEAVMIPGLLPAGLDIASLKVTWHWPGWEMMDPQKDALADTERLNNGTLSYEQYYAEQGKDWEEQFEQLAREAAKRQELGIVPKPTGPVEEEDSDAQDEEAQAAAA